MRFAFCRAISIFFIITIGIPGTLACEIPEDQKNLADRLEAECQRLYDSYGVNVFFDYDELNFFDFTLLMGPCATKATQVSLEAAMNNIPTLESCFQTYAPQVLRQNIQSIFLLGSMSMGQTPVGGLFLNSRQVYVVIPTQVEGLTSNFIIHVDSCIHHEFAHALFKKYASLFPKQDWMNANPPDFAYQGDALGVIDQGIDAASGHDYWEQGFISGYSTATINEDEAVLAEHYFTHFEYLMKLASAYPSLARKVQLFESFMDKVVSAGY